MWWCGMTWFDILWFTKIWSHSVTGSWRLGTNIVGIWYYLIVFQMIMSHLLVRKRIYLSMLCGLPLTISETPMISTTLADPPSRQVGACTVCPCPDMHHINRVVVGWCRGMVSKGCMKACSCFLSCVATMFKGAGVGGNTRHTENGSRLPASPNPDMWSNT